ncbi:MAG TPA: sigma-70 family RNA polymerase sigma factor [Pirellulales bacterium]|nr:sigma-70 family RNA polymerase sigma factor [Pirellulales bacterium]
MADGVAALEIAQLVAEHHAALYRYAYRLSGSVPDAEDLTQQVFLIAHERLNQVRDPARARGWLFAILRNCYLKSHRQPRLLAAATIDFDVNMIADDPLDQPLDGEQLQSAINSLSDDFKVVILLFYFEQCSYREISETLDVPLGTVMSRLARAKAHLRRRLIECGERDESKVAGNHIAGGTVLEFNGARPKPADAGSRGEQAPVLSVGFHRPAGTRN